MTFEDYLLKGFSIIDARGKSEDEQLTIIKEALKALAAFKAFDSVKGGNGEDVLEEERQKFLLLVSSGADIDSTIIAFQNVLSMIAQYRGIESFEDLAELPSILSSLKQ